MVLGGVAPRRGRAELADARRRVRALAAWGASAARIAASEGISERHVRRLLAAPSVALSSPRRPRWQRAAAAGVGRETMRRHDFVRRRAPHLALRVARSELSVARAYRLARATEICHQRRIREEWARREPREPLPNLDGCTVGCATVAEIRGLIRRYEWLGRLGRTRAAYALRGPDGRLLGAAAFGFHAGTGARGICGPDESHRVIVLERGACVHWAPRNAASFLIRRACELVRRDTGCEVILAYADPAAGEVGTVYQAAGWLYLGRGPGHGRPRRQVLVPPGADPDDPRSLRTTRLLSHNRVRGLAPASIGEARALGWRVIMAPVRRMYAWIEPAGDTRRARRRRRAELIGKLRHRPLASYPKRASTATGPAARRPISPGAA